MANKKILIVCGEPSGDLHASNLVRDLKSLNPTLRFYGVGGELSKSSGVEVIFDITRLALVGYLDVLKNIFVVKKAFDAVISRIKTDRPDIAILVDYPGFNLRLAKQLARRNIPVVYYISPQVWAWGRDRIERIKKHVKKMICFFPFETELYKRYGIDAEFAGHPLVDIVKVTASRDDVYKKHSLSKEKKAIAILPGSRESEIKTLLPVIAKAADLIDKEMGNVQFVISKRSDRHISIYEKALSGTSFDYRLIEGDMYNMTAAVDFAIVASGTATLETGMLGTPLLIVYKTNLITYLLYLIVADIRTLGLVNIVAGREVAPELLQYEMTPCRIADKTIEMLSNPDRLAKARKELSGIKSSLGPGGASMRAAKAILPLIGTAPKLL